MQLNILQHFAKKKRIHLDYASATPVHPEVFRAMRPYFSDEWANASAIYQEGVRVREVVEGARAELAHLLRVRPSDVVYTSGGTESNNLAILGTIARLRDEQVAYEDIEIISTRIEHPSVREALAQSESLGVVVRSVAVDEMGRIDLAELQTLFSAKTRLVTCAYVNSEIGVIQDVKKIARMARAWSDTHATKVLVHVDACQAPLWLPCALDQLGVDMLSLDAGKCYGPKGVGVLVKRHGVKLAPVVYGGGQEQGLRPGTENVPLVVGCTRALVRAQEGHERRSARARVLRDYCIQTVETAIPTALINGSLKHRVANNVNISLPGIEGEYAVITLDAHGVAASTRSACGAGKGEGSHVVREISGNDARARSTIRLTFGETTTRHDIDRALAVLKSHCTLMQTSKL